MKWRKMKRDSALKSEDWIEKEIEKIIWNVLLMGRWFDSVFSECPLFFTRIFSVQKNNNQFL